MGTQRIIIKASDLSPRESNLPPHKEQSEQSLADFSASAATTTRDELLRELTRLIAIISPSHETLPSDAQGQSVILDVEFDGARYVIIKSQSKLGSTHSTLSPREQEIARMVAEGYPNKAIAAVLDISSWTVNTHLRRIFAKLGVHTRAAMIAHLMEANDLSEQPLGKPSLQNSEASWGGQTV